MTEPVVIDRDIRISTVGRDDYPELEGKLIETDYETGVVVGCNRSLGITIVDAQNKDHFLVCFAGPIAPGGGTDFSDYTCTYMEMFDYTLECIKAGVIDMTAIHRVYRGDDTKYGECNGRNCAYSQQYVDYSIQTY